MIFILNIEKYFIATMDYYTIRNIRKQGFLVKKIFNMNNYKSKMLLEIFIMMIYNSCTVKHIFPCLVVIWQVFFVLCRSAWLYRRCVDRMRRHMWDVWTGYKKRYIYINPIYVSYSACVRHYSRKCVGTRTQGMN